MPDDKQTSKKRVYADTSDGGSVELTGPNAWRLGDVIRDAIEGRAASVPADLVQPQHWIWPRESEGAPQVWAAFDPNGVVQPHTIESNEDNAWMALQGGTGRSLNLMEQQGWTVRRVIVSEDRSAK